MKKIYVPDIGYLTPNPYQYLLSAELQSKESIQICGGERQVGTTTLLANYLSDKMAEVGLDEDLVIMFFADNLHVAKYLKRPTLDIWLAKHLSAVINFLDPELMNGIVRAAEKKFGLHVSPYAEHRMYGYKKSSNYIFVNSWFRDSNDVYQTIGRQCLFPNKQIIMERI